MIPAVGTLLPLALLIAPSAGLMRFISRPGVLMAASACAALAVCAFGFVLGWMHCLSFRTFLLRVRGLGGSGLEAESQLNPSAAARYPPEK